MCVSLKMQAVYGIYHTLLRVFFFLSNRWSFVIHGTPLPTVVATVDCRVILYVSYRFEHNGSLLYSLRKTQVRKFPNGNRTVDSVLVMQYDFYCCRFYGPIVLIGAVCTEHEFTVELDFLACTIVATEIQRYRDRARARRRSSNMQCNSVVCVHFLTTRYWESFTITRIQLHVTHSPLTHSPTQHLLTSAIAIARVSRLDSNHGLYRNYYYYRRPEALRRTAASLRRHHNSGSVRNFDSTSTWRTRTLDHRWGCRPRGSSCSSRRCSTSC